MTVAGCAASMRTLVSVMAVAALVVLAPGCKGACRQLSEKMCDCTVNSTDKNSCLTYASQDETAYPPTAADEQRCEELLPQCDCRLIDTPEGKVKCGLSRVSDAGY